MDNNIFVVMQSAYSPSQGQVDPHVWVFLSREAAVSKLESLRGQTVVGLSILFGARALVSTSLRIVPLGEQVTGTDPVDSHSHYSLGNRG